MKLTRILAPMAIAVAAAVGAEPVLAGPSGYAPPMPSAPPAVYEAGTVMLRIGASYIDLDDDSGKWRYDRDLQPFFDGLRYDLDGETTWNFSVGFMPIDHMSVELGYIGKAEHDLDLTGLDSDFVQDFGVSKIRAGSIDRRSATLMFNWFPVCKESWVQPYVGIGAHYTDYDSVRFRTAANDYLAEVAGAIGPAKLYLEDDWGWAGQIGIDIMLGRESNWLVNAAVQYLDSDVQTDLHYQAPNFYFSPTTVINAARTDIELDSWVYNLGIGYRF
ncbi:OmpW family outer membrane protein [Microbulbifer thermotolerans]|uniref:OmpW/AlkL family protein n=1 Tax=Microbulbifer thermotolerans TaxID=252514 RepID=UPI00267132B3|nr:OmpW family outer membrane protein [Microbulbifer thermotolerans]WKT59296.1 OmpW family outer membrane protein [Microbulbifer thermotolerans]